MTLGNLLMNSAVFYMALISTFDSEGKSHKLKFFIMLKFTYIKSNFALVGTDPQKMRKKSYLQSKVLVISYEY